MDYNCGECVEFMGVASGWNLWVWLSGGGCGWNIQVGLVGIVVRRYMYMYIDFLILLTLLHLY